MLSSYFDFIRQLALRRWFPKGAMPVGAASGGSYTLVPAALALCACCGLLQAQSTSCFGTSASPCTTSSLGVGTTNPGSQTLAVSGPTQISNTAGARNSVANGVLGVGDGAPQPNNIIFADGSVTLPAAGNGTGVLSALNVYPGVSSSAEIDASGVAGQVYWNGTGSSNPVGFAIGGNFQATLQGTSGLLGWLKGGSLAAVSVSPGAITNARGGEFNVTNEGGGTITTAMAGLFSGGNAAGSSIGTWYGGYFANPATGAGINSSYGIYLENQTGATNNYAIYSVGGKSYFGGPIGLGVTSPTCAGATKTCMLAVAGAISSQEMIVTATGAK